MNKKRNKKFLIPLFVTIPLFIVCLILLLIPKTPSDFLFYNVDYTDHTGMGRYGFDVTFNIKNNSDDDVLNASIYIEYTVEHHFNDIEHSTTINEDLLKGKNELSFTYEEEDFGIYSFSEIKKMTISADGKTYEVLPESSMNKPNWLILGGIIICFIVSAVCFSLWLSSNTSENISSRSNGVFRNIFVSPSAENESEKVICSYCKCKFDAEKHTKCPNCGAPLQH